MSKRDTQSRYGDGIFQMETPHAIFFFQQTQNKRIFDDAILLSNIHMLSAFIYVFPRVVFTDSDLTIKTFAGLR